MYREYLHMLLSLVLSCSLSVRVDRPATSGNPVNDGSTTTQYTDPDPASYPQRGPEPRTDDLFVYQPDHAGSPTNKEQRNPEIALNVAGAGSSRAPSSPFEMMFGRSLQEAYQQTFGSLFGNLNRGVSQPGAALSGGQVGFEGGSDGRARGAGFDNDVSSLGSFSNPYGSGKNLFDADVNGIVNKRPSLRLFGRK
ncbi:hypothetical protein BaRGS_00017124 [Batillaria attramentaria]|uniref:Uncharacterized protein n=1 Tax=Batillaria attramentaria TaxID=370345 RepID=A0ABD0KX78_9CAEN